MGSTLIRPVASNRKGIGVMLAFLKSVFGGSSQERRSSVLRQEPSISYEGLSFQDLLALSQSLPPKPEGKMLTALARRYYHIALYDNHIPQEQRDAALKLAEALTADLERAVASNPQSLAALRDATTFIVDNVRRNGYGSLAWKITEYSISNADTISYIMKSEHRDLLPDFLGIMPPDAVAAAKPHMVRQLVIQSGYETERAVFIVNNLVAEGDRTRARPDGISQKLDTFRPSNDLLKNPGSSNAL